MAACSVGEVAGDEQCGDQVGLEAALALLEVAARWPFLSCLPDDRGAGARLPAGIGDEVAIVLHGLGPVVHEVLIDIVGIEQRRGLEGGEQVLGDGFDERLGMAVLGEALEQRGVGRLPLREELAWPWSLKAVNSGWPKMAGFTSAMGSLQRGSSRGGWRSRTRRRARRA